MAKKWIFYGKTKFEGHFQNLEQKVIDQFFLNLVFYIETMRTCKKITLILLKLSVLLTNLGYGQHLWRQL